MNKVCLSSLNAIALADQLIRAGEVSAVVAGGMESMDCAPYLLPKARTGYRMGDGTLVDSMIHDGLWDAFTRKHMGDQSDDVNKEFAIAREDQDAWAVRSHARAHAATVDGRFREEIVPFEVPVRSGNPVLFDADEGIRPDTTLETLASLKPAFQPDGTITAGNASQVSNGAAAVVVMSRSKAEALGVTPKAEVVGYGTVAGPDTSLLTQPSGAIKQALERADLSLDDLSLFEINEAFAAVVLRSMADLGIDDELVNVNGGAIALGHPIGMSGARLAITLVEELQRRGGGLGAAALCGGGGQGDAILLKVD